MNSKVSISILPYSIGIAFLGACDTITPDCPANEDKFEVSSDEWVIEYGAFIDCPPGTTDVQCDEFWCTVEEPEVYCVDSERLREWTSEHGYVMHSDETEQPSAPRCDPTPED